MASNAISRYFSLGFYGLTDRDMIMRGMIYTLFFMRNRLASLVSGLDIGILKIRLQLFLSGCSRRTPSRIFFSNWWTTFFFVIPWTLAVFSCGLTTFEIFFYKDVRLSFLRDSPIFHVFTKSNLGYDHSSKESFLARNFFWAKSLLQHWSKLTRLIMHMTIQTRVARFYSFIFVSET